MASFDPIMDKLKHSDYISGAFLLEKPVKRSWKETLLAISFPLFVLNMLALAISTPIISNYTPFSIILASLAYSTNFAMCYVWYILKRNKSKIHRFLQWCNDLFDIEKKFYPAVRDIATIKLENVQQRTLKVLKWVKIILIVDYLVATVGITVIGLLLPQNIYPKYSLPFPYFYLFSNHKNWISFGFGVMGQTMAAIQIAIFLIFFFGLFYVPIVHVMAVLEIIKDVMKKFTDDMNAKALIEDVDENESELPGPSRGLNIKTLANIWKGRVLKVREKDDNSLEFDEWCKIIVEMINDVNEMMTQLNFFFCNILLLAEIISFACLFLFAMLILVVKKPQFLIIGILWGPALLLKICQANETIIDKFSEISDEFYNIPWYNLNTKQRKALLIAMECDKIQKGLYAGKFHQLNVERFAKIVNAAYKNSLVLRDLALKGAI